MEIIHSLDVNEGYSHHLAFSPNNRMIAVSSDHAIQLFDTLEGELIETMNLKPKGIYGVAFSPDGKLLAMGAADKKIRVWQIP